MLVSSLQAGTSTTAADSAAWPAFLSQHCLMTTVWANADHSLLVKREAKGAFSPVLGLFSLKHPNALFKERDFNNPAV